MNPWIRFFIIAAMTLLPLASSPALVAGTGDPGAAGPGGLVAGISDPGEAGPPSAMAATGEPDWQAKLDAGLLEQAEAGPAEFLLVLAEQADLSGAEQIDGKAAKGQYVYEQLTTLAERTQKPALERLQALKQANPSLEYQPYWVTNMIWVRGDAAVLQALAARPDIARVHANPWLKMDLPERQPVQPDDPQSTTAPDTIEWNINQVRAPQAWAAGYTGQGVVIGGQDTGYQWDHPALKGKYRGWNGASANHNYNWHDAIHSGVTSCGVNSPFPCDDGYHGTHTMGTMVGDDGGSNQTGMAPGARWIGCRNMSEGYGTPATYAECYQWFIAPTDLSGSNPRPDLAPDVINNSWSCPEYEGCTDPLVLLNIVNAVRAAGIVTVHSAGNSGPSCSSIDEPAAIYDASFSVGATDGNDNLASFSSRGPVTVDGSNRLKPDVSAPGVNVRSSVPGGGYSSLQGTSMAAPHVTGLVALLISAHPTLAGDVDQIEAVIRQSAVPRTTSQICGDIPGSQVPNNSYGYGRVDALAAIQFLRPHILSLSKLPLLPYYIPGGVITYRLQVHHAHPTTPVTNVLLSDTIPVGTVFVGATGSYTKVGDVVQWTFASIPPGGQVSVDLVVQTDANGSGPVSNEIYAVTSSEVGPVSGPAVVILPLADMHFFYLANVFR